jgi:uridine kinase
MTTLELVDIIKGLNTKPNRLIVVAISGFGGSGKSTLARTLAAAVKGAEVVSIDDFIVGPKDERSGDWNTFDRDRLRDEVLIPARPDRAVSYQQYHSGEWVKHVSGKRHTIKPHKYLIVEGCGILHPTLLPYFDFSVWIDCPEPEALKRAEARDLSQGNDDRLLWEEVWRLNDLDCFRSYHPDQLASAIVKPNDIYPSHV